MLLIKLFSTRRIKRRKIKLFSTRRIKRRKLKMRRRRRKRKRKDLLLYPPRTIQMRN
jgi:hypothetical protein